MAYCSKCGAPIIEGGKFCSACGSDNIVDVNSVSNVVVNNSEMRVQEFAGKITKCPSCGEVLKALSVKCSSCGFELREVSNVSSVTAFTEKLSKTYSISQKIDIIREFPIPNAKEDIFEFLVLATSNFDTKKHVAALGSDRKISEAWLSKIEQAYVKAESLFKNDKDFAKFHELYDSDINELKAYEESLKGRKHYFYGSVLLLLSSIVAIIVMFIGSGPAANPRLDATIVVGFANGIISYMYASKKELKMIVLAVYIANAVMNIVFCFMATGHIINLAIIIVCALGAFFEKKQ